MGELLALVEQVEEALQLGACLHVRGEVRPGERRVIASSRQTIDLRGRARQFGPGSGLWRWPRRRSSHAP